MINYQEARVKLINIQLNKLKSAAKNKKETTLRLTKKNFEDKALPHELFLTTKLTIKIRNVIANSMLTDLKISEDQISNFSRRCNSIIKDGELSRNES